MGRSVPHNLKSTHQTEFVKIFNSLCGRYGRWEIWQDFITLAAIAISNTVDRSQAAEREKTYMTIAGKYKPEEMLKFSQMLQEVVIGMDFNPDQDFLGELYMALDLGNDHAGQFFTPYDVCRMMAEITGTDLQARIERDGWISVNDCACGAGALLVAFANACTRQEINYQTSVLFTAQDIDYIVGLMCYLQLSLMGCAGYVVIGDTLLHPSTALDRRGLIPRPDQNIWYTPFYFRDIWHYRRIWAQMDLLLQTDEKPAEQVTGKLKGAGCALKAEHWDIGVLAGGVMCADDAILDIRVLVAVHLAAVGGHGVVVGSLASVERIGAPACHVGLTDGQEPGLQNVGFRFHVDAPFLRLAPATLRVERFGCCHVAIIRRGYSGRVFHASIVRCLPNSPRCS